MIEKDNKDISIRRQCELLGVNRSSLFYEHKPKEENPDLEHAVYDLWIKYPFYGYRRICQTLKKTFSGLTRHQVRKTMNKLKTSSSRNTKICAN